MRERERLHTYAMYVGTCDATAIATAATATAVAAVAAAAAAPWLHRLVILLYRYYTTHEYIRVFI